MFSNNLSNNSITTNLIRIIYTYSSTNSILSNKASESESRKGITPIAIGILITKAFPFSVSNCSHSYQSSLIPNKGFFPVKLIGS
jgi:hypothetical protein